MTTYLFKNNMKLNFKEFKKLIQDLKNDKMITTPQFKQRASQLLTSYGYVRPGKKYSYLENLLRGMPGRLQRCKSNKYGPCGK